MRTGWTPLLTLPLSAVSLYTYQAMGAVGLSGNVVLCCVWQVTVAPGEVSQLDSEHVHWVGHVPHPRRIASGHKQPFCVISEPGDPPGSGWGPPALVLPLFCPPLSAVPKEQAQGRRALGQVGTGGGAWRLAHLPGCPTSPPAAPGSFALPLCALWGPLPPPVPAWGPLASWSLCSKATF